MSGRLPHILVAVLWLAACTPENGDAGAGRQTPQPVSAPLSRYAPLVFELAIENRAVAMEGDVIRVPRGQKLELRWTSDESVEVHLHGYDIAGKVEPGTPLVMSLEALTRGRFPIETHGSGRADEHVTLLYLEVR